MSLAAFQLSWALALPAVAASAAGAEGAVVSPGATGVALAVLDAALRLPAASMALTV